MILDRNYLIQMRIVKHDLLILVDTYWWDILSIRVSRTAKYIVIIHYKLSIRKIEFGGKGLSDSVLGFILVGNYKRKYLKIPSDSIAWA